MKLSKAILRQAEPKLKSYKKADSNGLYIEVNPNGSKLWRIAYRFEGKSKTLYLGSYPAISLAKARQELIKAKKMLAAGIDPGEFKKEGKKLRSTVPKTQKITFRSVAQEWLNDYSRKVLPKQISKIERHLEKYLYPAFGDIPVMNLSAVQILEPAMKKELEGKVHTAHRLINLTGQVLDEAILRGYIQHNLIRHGLAKKLTREKTKHLAAITEPQKLGELLCDIEDYAGSAVVKYFLQIIPYVFTRNSELRKANWKEFDLDDEKIWVIPRARMKAKEQDHKVPLSNQVLALLLELKQLTGDGAFLFPSKWAQTPTISEAAPLAALRKMGYDKNTMTIHGFRATASTCLNELGYPIEHIAKQLAHKERDEIREAYNRAEYLKQRRLLLQDWADVLDRFREETRSRRSESATEKANTLL